MQHLKLHVVQLGRNVEVKDGEDIFNKFFTLETSDFSKIFLNQVIGKLES